MVWGKVDISALPIRQHLMLLEFTVGEKQCISASGYHPLEITLGKNSLSEQPVPLLLPSEIKLLVSIPAPSTFQVGQAPHGLSAFWQSGYKGWDILPSV